MYVQRMNACKLPRARVRTSTQMDIQPLVLCIRLSPSLALPAGIFMDKTRGEIRQVPSTCIIESCQWMVAIFFLFSRYPQWGSPAWFTLALRFPCDVSRAPGVFGLLLIIVFLLSTNRRECHCLWIVLNYPFFAQRLPFSYLSSGRSHGKRVRTPYGSVWRGQLLLIYGRFPGIRKVSNGGQVSFFIHSEYRASNAWPYLLCSNRSCSGARYNITIFGAKGWSKATVVSLATVASQSAAMFSDQVNDSYYSVIDIQVSLWTNHFTQFFKSNPFYIFLVFTLFLSFFHITFFFSLFSFF